MQRVPRPRFLLPAVAAAAMMLNASVGRAQTKTDPKAAPAHAKILNGFKKVVSTVDGKKAMYDIYVRKSDQQMIAELPANVTTQRYFIGLTVSSGERFAGLQSGDLYVYWRKFNNRLALIEPNTGTRSTGDIHSKASVKRLFTDKVLLDVPILGKGPGGGHLIDFDALLVSKATVFFGPQYGNYKFPRLFEIKSAKAFPQNVELAFEFPTMRGQLQTLHYSISVLPKATGYKPRKADQRVGYFTTSYSDLGKYSDKEVRTRFINRWHLEKADPKLKISPPKNPIVFYIEHTVPIRYRRWVEKGILDWNKAFEKVGIHNAIKVHFQDAKTGAFMDLDPEDVRYNFVRWLNNDIGTAIGPSRVDPRTGQILDADIVLTDGWIRYYNFNFADLLPKTAMQGFDGESLAWLAKHPGWDPRIRFANPAHRDTVRRLIQLQAMQPNSGHAMSKKPTRMLGDDPHDGLVGRTVQVNGRCDAAGGLAFEVALMKLHLAALKDEKKKPAGKKKAKKKPSNKIDGMPESFVGPLLAHLVSHEVGHTIGLRHNFKGSAVNTLADINSNKLKGKKTFSGSVMDYTPININFKGGKVQGDWAMLEIGPYDYWAIEYGYTFEKDLSKILARASEPELQFGTDEDAGGPDPLVRRHDFSKNPLDFANEQVRLAEFHRSKILSNFVKKGESWAQARRGYELTLNLQMKAVSMMGNWIGGAHVRRDKKGDKGNRAPIQVVPAKTQRDALKFVIANSFHDKNFGLTPELLRHMTVDKWLEGNNYLQVLRQESAWPVHDNVMAFQASTLTMLMRPTILRRVYDNEFRVPEKQDALTLPEVMAEIRKAIWTEATNPKAGKYSARSPMISSLRRNLQREHLKRLIDLTMPKAVANEAGKPIANIARLELRTIRTATDKALKTKGIDPYTQAHLTEVSEQVKKALDARYIYNIPKPTGGTRVIRIGNGTGQSQP